MLTSDLMIGPEEQTKPILNNVAAESGVLNKPLHTKTALRAVMEPVCKITRTRTRGDTRGRLLWSWLRN